MFSNCRQNYGHFKCVIVNASRKVSYDCETLQFRSYSLKVIHVYDVFVSSRTLCSNMCMDENVPNGRCYLEYVSVDATVRGKGVGAVLLARAEWEARRRNCKVIVVDGVWCSVTDMFYNKQFVVLCKKKSALLCQDGMVLSFWLNYSQRCY